MSANRISMVSVFQVCSSLHFQRKSCGTLTDCPALKGVRSEELHCNIFRYRCSSAICIQRNAICIVLPEECSEAVEILQSVVNYNSIGYCVLILDYIYIHVHADYTIL